MSSPKVSILTLTYNLRKFIGTTIESVLSQPMQDWEMFILDDGSTDDTAEVVARYKDKRIQFVPQKHQGKFSLGLSWNKGLAMSKGEFICQLDGDDYWTPETLNLLLPPFQDPNVVMSYGISQWVDENGKWIEGWHYPQTLKPEDGFPPSVLSNDPVGSAAKAMLLLNRNFPAPCGTLIRHSALKRLGGFKTTKNFATADRPTYFELSVMGKFAFIPKITAYYRRHSSNHSGDMESSALILEGLKDNAIEFVRRHGKTIGLTEREQRRVETQWWHSWISKIFLHGRVLLTKKDWGKAKNRFFEVLRMGFFSRWGAYSMIGYSCALARRDMEWLMNALGKPLNRRIW